MKVATKECRDCKRNVPHDGFYKHPTTKDGLYPSCKTCHKKYVKENRELKSDYYSEYYRRKNTERLKDPKYVEQQRSYRRTKRGKASSRRSTKAWRITHPDQYRLQNLRSAQKVREKRAAMRQHKTDETARIASAKESPSLGIPG